MLSFTLGNVSFLASGRLCQVIGAPTRISDVSAVWGNWTVVVHVFAG